MSKNCKLTILLPGHVVLSGPCEVDQDTNRVYPGTGLRDALRDACINLQAPGVRTVALVRNEDVEVAAYAMPSGFALYLDADDPQPASWWRRLFASPLMSAVFQRI